MLYLIKYHIPLTECASFVCSDSESEPGSLKSKSGSIFNSSLISISRSSSSSSSSSSYHSSSLTTSGSDSSSSSSSSSSALSTIVEYVTSKGKVAPVTPDNDVQVSLSTRVLNSVKNVFDTSKRMKPRKTMTATLPISTRMVISLQPPRNLMVH